MICVVYKKTKIIMYCKIIIMNVNLLSKDRKQNSRKKQNKNKIIKIKQIYESKTIKTKILIIVNQIKSNDKCKSVV